MIENILAFFLLPKLATTLHGPTGGEHRGRVERSECWKPYSELVSV